MHDDTPLHLSFNDGRPDLRDLAEVQAALLQAGVGLWPLDLTSLPAEARHLLEPAVLSAEERAELLAACLLPRDRLLAIIADAGRSPQVAGGGALETRVVNHGYDYPQLFVQDPDSDFGRFERYHVNRADDGTAVDEVIQILSGGGIRILRRLEDGSELVLSLDCPDGDQGWLLTYEGGRPHIGSLSRARPGTKAVVQVIGPPTWTMTDLDD
ncbi:MAG: hypothetical protein Kilf2KO_09650 [Rhodospirillales bacterium]